MKKMYSCAGVAVIVCSLLLAEVQLQQVHAIGPKEKQMRPVMKATEGHHQLSNNVDLKEGVSESAAEPRQVRRDHNGGPDMSINYGSNYFYYYGYHSYYCETYYYCGYHNYQPNCCGTNCCGYGYDCCSSSNECVLCDNDEDDDNDDDDYNDENTFTSIDDNYYLNWECNGNLCYYQSSYYYEAPTGCCGGTCCYGDDYCCEDGGCTACSTTVHTTDVAAIVGGVLGGGVGGCLLIGALIWLGIYRTAKMASRAVTDAPIMIVNDNIPIPVAVKKASLGVTMTSVVPNHQQLGGIQMQSYQQVRPAQLVQPIFYGTGAPPPGFLAAPVQPTMPVVGFLPGGPMPVGPMPTGSVLTESMMPINTEFGSSTASSLPLGNPPFMSVIPQASPVAADSVGYAAALGTGNRSPGYPIVG
jgi:hypothetical protein